MKGLQFFIKRLFDIIVSFLMLIVLSPLLIIIVLLIKISSKGPVFFIQERAGLHGEPFNIFKFRTMIVNAEKVGLGYYTEENDPRITKVGKFLRKWSLDELPQLINIFKGEMSIIGPRPTLMYQIKEYTDEQRKRLNMKPGVTGWAQVNGRNEISWPERIKLDNWYIENFSLLLDVKILLKTIKVVLKREGIYGEKENFDIKDK